MKIILQVSAVERVEEIVFLLFCTNSLNIFCWFIDIHFSLMICMFKDNYSNLYLQGSFQHQLFLNLFEIGPCYRQLKEVFSNFFKSNNGFELLF